jgi:hypothetical protein
VRVKYWDHCSQSQENRLELGCISRTDRNGRQFWVGATEREDAGRFVVHADARRGDGKRFVVRAEEKLTAFLELEAGAVRPLPA